MDSLEQDIKQFLLTSNNMRAQWKKIRDGIYDNHKKEYSSLSSFGVTIDRALKRLVNVGDINKEVAGHRSVFYFIPKSKREKINTQLLRANIHKGFGEYWDANTPEQRKIDREIKAIEKRYEEKKLRKQKNKERKIKKIKTIEKQNDGDFGNNAGKIWNILEVYGPQNQSFIVEITKLSIDDFFIAIGWLAREDKISKEMNYYKLGNTNLTNEIGNNAGKIWKILDSMGQIDILCILKQTEMKIEEIYSAIGWLSRENKIKFQFKDSKLIFELT